jgi:hypothetical protein
MAKRARGSHRPGQRAPLQRTTRPGTPPAPSTTSTSASAAVAPRPAELTPQEEARAAALEAQIVAEEKAADESRRRSADRGRTRTGDSVPRSTLAVSAAEEYAYVGRDVRRISLIGGSLIILMVALAAISHATGAGPI